MISFFRKIRQNLLKENKTARYFKYAIGEIVLVVIGILIALQINNWNQQRIEGDKKKVYLKNIKRDLQYQLVIIDLQLEYENKYLVNIQPILDQFNQAGEFVLDINLLLNLSNITERKTFVRTDPTYTDLISSGNIDIIKDLVFKDKLIMYYQNVERVELIIQNNNIHINDNIFYSNIIKFVYLDTGNIIQSTEMLEISNSILQKKENKLRLINLVNMRKTVADSIIVLMNEIKIQTQELLNLMKNTP